jgi:hypothetical protein
MPTLIFFPLEVEEEEDEDDEELLSELLEESSEPHAVSPTGMTSASRTTANSPRRGDRVMARQAIGRCGA